MRRALLQALVLAGLALVPASISGVLQLRHHPAETVAPGEVAVETARRWGDGALLVDARPRARYEVGHISGAVLLNEEEWETLYPPFLDAWDPDKKIVVYCDGGSCETSHEVAERLKREMDLPTVWVLKGGWPAWERK